MIFAIPAAAALLCAGYSVIPTYYHKLLDPRAIRKIHKKDHISLTFDDGPDPRYTGTLLDILKEYQIHATFFVVAQKAEKYPELIHRILEEGHELGLHSLEHGNGLVKGYRYTRQDFEKSLNIMRSHHWSVKYFRPPWGHSNLFTKHFANKYGLKLVYWNVMAQDWKADATSFSITSKLIRRVKSGSIICLHDSGGCINAPARTLSALRKAIPLLKQQGYIFTGVEENEKPVRR